MLQQREARWSNPKVLAIVAVVFLCGAAVGCALTQGYLHANMPNPNSSALTIERARSLGLEKLRVELGLSDVQQRTIAKVLDDYGKFYQNIEDEREDVAEHGKRHIFDVLTAEQKAKFDKFIGRRTH